MSCLPAGKVRQQQQQPQQPQQPQQQQQQHLPHWIPINLPQGLSFQQQQQQPPSSQRLSFHPPHQQGPQQFSALPAPSSHQTNSVRNSHWELK